MLSDDDIATRLKAALAASASEEPSATAEMKARVLARVARSTGMPLPASESTSSSAATPESNAALRLVRAGLPGKLVIAGVVALIGGAAMLSMQDRAPTPPAPASLPPAEPVVPAAPTASQAPTTTADSTPVVDLGALPSVTGEPPRPKTPVTRNAPAASSSAGRAADTLLAEGAVIERARASVRRGDARSALAAIDEHASEFPRGELAEERESLRVRVLVMLGRHDEARVAADRFAQTYPRSLFKPIVARAIESIP